MEYEKKYKEALKWVQKLYSLFEGWVKEDAEHYFPELKSEDEKIRKAIHIYLDWLDGRKDYQPKGAYTIKDMIAWLEKQDEQSVEPKWCHYNVDLSNCSEEYRKAYYDGWTNCIFQHSQWKAESDDKSEKIRKEIIEFIKSRGGFKREYIDWLEKQGKKLTDKIEPKFKVCDFS